MAGTEDVIAPVPCVRRALDVLTGARSLRYAEAPGSHLGVLSGSTAPATTWQHITDFLDEVGAEENRPADEPPISQPELVDPPGCRCGDRSGNRPANSPASTKNARPASGPGRRSAR